MEQIIHQNMDNLKDQIDSYNILDQFDRDMLRQGLMLLNQNSREGQEIYKKAQEKNII